ncbi:cation-binding protein [Catellatospora methionotrophica]|uniref:Cation-binding protein n=1 Tax=Catellatospora methionotrophica TaxID=121620 RepID=A0A8J3LDY4_9ACTN|nr:hemerythrin domain-containing protein [Catellatospora methionotrophica]GIG16498.1 cation-binding protein [Catellatospora methionotrophica]
MDDITALILDDHAAFRRGFARLDDASDTGQMRAVWEPLALHLEIHAEAEEVILYPHLLRRGGEDAEEESLDAIRDHNKIRDAIAESRRHEVGSDPWWAAVWQARRENTEHLGEEEDEGLPDFRRHASVELRAKLGEQWLAFYGEHPDGRGLVFRDKDPERYVASAQPQDPQAQQ